MAIRDAIRRDPPFRPSAGYPSPASSDDVFALSIPSGAKSVLRRFDAELEIIGPTNVSYTFDAEMVIAEGDIRRFDAHMEIVSSIVKQTFQTEMTIENEESNRFDSELQIYVGGTPRERRFDAEMSIVNTSDLRRFDARLAISRTKTWRFDARMGIVDFNPLAGLRRIGGDAEHL